MPRLIDAITAKQLLDARESAFSRLFRPGNHDTPDRVSWNYPERVSPHPTRPGIFVGRVTGKCYNQNAQVVSQVATYVTYDEAHPATPEDFDRAERELRGRPTYDPRVGRSVIDITPRGGKDGTD